VLPSAMMQGMLQISSPFPIGVQHVGLGQLRWWWWLLLLVDYSHKD